MNYAINHDCSEVLRLLINIVKTTKNNLIKPKNACKVGNSTKIKNDDKFYNLSCIFNCQLSILLRFPAGKNRQKFFHLSIPDTVHEII